MTSVKILGAGSIGNHLSHAARALGWRVDLCDIDPAALARTRNEIYPGRYGSWDPEIRLLAADEAPKGGYDFIFIGTPPDHHLPLAIDAVKEGARAVLVEKPLCGPDLDGAQELYERAGEAGVPVFVGYDHVVGQAARRVAATLAEGAIGAVGTIDVEFREHWGGIFAAHPWLDGPADTYLGHWRRGGGASGEHSHAANLWQHFAHAAGAGRVIEVFASLDMVDDGTVEYDRLCLANLRTEQGLMGRVVQDVITRPPRKWARVQGGDGFVEWICGAVPGRDVVVRQAAGKEPDTARFDKTRPDDFIEELRHIAAAVESGDIPPDISLARGLDTMLVVAAMHMSARARRAVTIDYDRGYRTSALKLA